MRVSVTTGILVCCLTLISTTVNAQNVDEAPPGYSSQVLHAGGGTFDTLNLELQRFTEGISPQEIEKKAKSELPPIVMEQISIAGNQKELNIKVASQVPLKGLAAPLSFNLEKLPSQGGLLLVQLKAGQLATIDENGERRVRREGEWWVVSQPSDFRVETDDDTAVIDTILILPK